MTVSTTDNRVSYAGNGVTTAFSFPNLFFADSDLVVLLVNDTTGASTTQTLTTHYTVSGAENPAGGTVTMVTAPATGYTLVIYRDPPLTQTIDLVNGDAFDVETGVERAFDKAVLIAQRHQDLIERSFRLPDSDTSGADPTLPIPEASTLIGWNSTGTALQNNVPADLSLSTVSTFINTLLDDTTAAAARTTLGAVGLTGNDTISGNKTFRGTIVSDGTVNYCALSGTDTYTGTVGIASYVTGAEFAIYVANANTGAATINLDSLGAKTVLNQDGLALIAGEMYGHHRVRYDGTYFVLLNRSGRIKNENVRQTVLAGAVDTNGQASFLSAGTGLAITMSAATTPVVATFAAGEDEEGQINYRTKFSADQASYWSSLPATNTVFLLLDRNTSSGAVTAYSTIVPPQYAPVFDKTKNALLPFSGADASTTITDTYGNTWTASGNAQVDTGVLIDSQNTLLLDGTGDYVQSTGITSLGGDSWTVECKVRFNALPGAGTNKAIITLENAGSYGAVLYLNNTAGTYKLGVYLSSNGTSWDLASGTLGTSTTYATGTTYHVTIGYDAVAGKYYVYREGVVDITVSTSSRICPITKFTLGASPGSPGTFGDLSGAFAGVRFSTCCRYPNGTTFTVPTLPFTADAEWFDISEYKWKYGSPTSWTTKHRVAVGETVTSAAGITSATTYALRGRYHSPQTIVPAGGTATSVSHNIGTTNIRTQLELVNIFTEAGYTVGDRCGEFMSVGGAGGSENMGQLPYFGRLTMGFTTGSYSTGIYIANKSTGAYAAITAANWKYLFTAQRNF